MSKAGPPYFRWSGYDVYSPLLIGALCAPLLLIGTGTWKLMWWAGALLLVALAAPVQIVVEVNRDGILVRRRWLWLITYSRRRFSSDAQVELYDTFDSPEPEGLYVTTRLGEKESDIFAAGKKEPELEALAKQFNDAIARLRQDRLAKVSAPIVLLPAALQPHRPHLDLQRAERNEYGRLRSVKTTAPFSSAGIDIPPGSELAFVSNEYRDPSTPDQLHAVRVSESVAVPFVSRPVIANARLSFDATLSHVSAIHEGFEGTIQIEGLPLRGKEVISFDEAGRFSGGVLAEDHRLGEWLVPSGSRLWAFSVGKVLHGDKAGRFFTCWLGGELQLPEVTLKEGDSIEINLEGRLFAFSPKEGPVQLPDGVVQHGIMSIPVEPDGRIDRGDARKKGLLK